VLVFLLLSSEDGFSTEWKEDDKGILRAPAVYNGAPPCIAAMHPRTVQLPGTRTPVVGCRAPIDTGGVESRCSRSWA
jgi:hypothetical protein